MTQQSDHFSRHAGFELLRIISMMMIVLMHGIGHGGLGTTAAPGTFPYFIYWLLFMLGRVSTNCFVMLTGYFMWQSRTKASPAVSDRNTGFVLFSADLCDRSVCRFFLLSAGTLLRAVFPTTSCVYWFCSCYFILYLAIPLLNKIIASLTRAQHRFMLLLLFLLFSYGRPSASGPTRHGWKTAIVMYGFSFFIYRRIHFHLSDPTVLSSVCSFMLSFPCSLFWCESSAPDRSTDGTGRNARHTRRIPVSDRVFRIRLLLFVLPEYQNSGQSPEKNHPCDRPAFFWRIFAA